jgi:hypothetical protein
MLAWNGPDEGGVYRAYDDLAMYVIVRGPSGHYRVGFFPGAGPECPWEDRQETFGEAKASAERCVDHVRQVKDRLARENSRRPRR